MCQSEGLSTANSDAVVVLGHGSRSAAAAELLEWVTAGLAARLDCPVGFASLQFNRPTLAERCREMAEAGARRIVVAPYFLFEGNHLLEDIPEELDRIRAELAGVELVLAGSLGADDRLVEVLAERVAERMEALRRSAPQSDSNRSAAQSDGKGDALQHDNTACHPERSEGSAFEHSQDSASQNKGLPQHPIEKQSFDIIDGLLQPADPDEPAYQVARRVVHTTGDPSLAAELLIAPGALERATAAIHAGAPVVCDVNMVLSGVAPTARSLGLAASCGVADPEVAALAKSEELTRGAAAMRLKASRGGLDGAIVAIGNAPTALLEVLRLADEEGVRPALVVGMPVGFVDAAESKQALAESDLPFITLPGNRGGSGMAVAIVNALMRLAAAQPREAAASAPRADVPCHPERSEGSVQILRRSTPQNDREHGLSQNDNTVGAGSPERDI